MNKFWPVLLFLLSSNLGFAFDLNCHKCSGMVEIAPGQSIYLEKQGNNGPFVIFDSGLGFGTKTWHKIIPEISNVAQTITFDRFGLGKSTPSPEKVSLYLASDSTHRLRTALEKLKVPRPYILVGHSLGGLFVQYYARNFSDEVSAVVLVDSATPNEPRVNSPFKPLNPTPQEFKDGYLKSLDLISQSPKFPDIPLYVLTANQKNWPYKEQWFTLQSEISKSSNIGVQFLANESGHFIQEDQPNVVIQAIKSAILSVDAHGTNTNQTLNSVYESEAKNCDTLSCVRSKIDIINDKLLALLVQRTAYVRRAGDLKKDTKTANDQKRVDAQLEVISKKSDTLGLPREISLEAFKTIMINSIEFEQKYIDHLTSK